MNFNIKFDIIIITSNSVNHLEKTEDFEQLLSCAYNLLEKDGVLIFDALRPRFKYLTRNMDEYYDYLCEQSSDENLLHMVLFPTYNYTSKTDFEGLGYEVNKICTEMESFDEYVRKYEFDEYYDALYPVLSQKVKVSKDMSMEEICFLTF